MLEGWKADPLNTATADEMFDKYVKQYNELLSKRLPISTSAFTSVVVTSLVAVTSPKAAMTASLPSFSRSSTLTPTTSSTTLPVLVDSSL